jgi:RNA polymerase sigma-70 factor (ECF subfamily)
MAEPTTTCDSELLRQAAEGDGEAFAALYRRRQRAVYRYAMHMTGNTAIAEEVTQETFLALIRRPRLFDPERGTMEAYLVGVARNQVRRRLAERRKHVPLEEAGARADERAETPGRELDLRLLRRALAALPERYREAVVLCELEEMSYEDAAHAAGCAAGTIKSRLHRARALLQAKLARGLARCAG